MTNDEPRDPAASLGSIAKHDGSPEPKAHLPNTVHAGCRSCESDAGTGDILADARKWLADFSDSRDEQRTHYEGCHRSWTHSTCLIRKMADQIERLGALVEGMEAAIETSGFVYRNTDSGPNLVEYRSPQAVRR